MGEQRYMPFGQVRTDAGTVTQTDLGYTGQRNLDAQQNAYSLGLMDYNARFYDPLLGRFTQADSIVPGAGNPQAFNRYSYTLNNPIRYNDPTGHCIEEGDAPPGSPSYRNICPPLKIPTNHIAPRLDYGGDYTTLDAPITPTPNRCGSVVSYACGTATAIQATGTAAQATKAYTQCEIGRSIVTYHKIPPIQLKHLLCTMR